MQIIEAIMALTKEWFDETLEYRDERRISCPLCFNDCITEDTTEADILNHKCKLCNAESFDSFSGHLTVTTILENKSMINELTDSDLSSIKYALKQNKIDCPECISIDDEQYTCTYCWDAIITDWDYLIFKLDELKESELLEKLRGVTQKSYIWQ